MANPVVVPYPGTSRWPERPATWHKSAWCESDSACETEFRDERGVVLHMRWTAAQLPDLSGRVAVVTGANSGIGFRTSEALAAHGARVVLACRDLVRAEQAVHRIVDKHERQTSSSAGLDLSSMSSVREFAATWTGPLDILVNNAGVMAPPNS